MKSKFKFVVKHVIGSTLESLLVLYLVLGIADLCAGKKVSPAFLWIAIVLLLVSTWGLAVKNRVNEERGRARSLSDIFSYF